MWLSGDGEVHLLEDTDLGLTRDIQTDIYTYTHTYLHIHICIYIHTYIPIRGDANPNVALGRRRGAPSTTHRFRVTRDIQTDIYTYTHTYLHIYIYMYIYTHIYTDSGGRQSQCGSRTTERCNLLQHTDLGLTRDIQTDIYTYTHTYLHIYMCIYIHIYIPILGDANPNVALGRRRGAIFYNTHILLHILTRFWGTPISMWISDDGGVF